MLDNVLIKLIIATIIEQESIAGIDGTPIKQAFQPTQQGVNTQQTAYLHKIGDRRLGTPLRTNVWNELTQTMVHTETQVYETTFQISALSTQNPSNTTQYTASDVLNLIAYILQSEQTINTFLAQDVGILRISEVRNTYFEDDRQRHEASPSLDFILTHKQIVASNVNVIQSTELNIEAV